MEPKLKYERVGNDLGNILTKEYLSCFKIHKKYIAFGTEWGNIYILDHLGNRIDSKEMANHSTIVNDISINQNGEYIASCSQDGKINITGLYTEELNFSYKMDTDVRCIAINPNYSKTSNRLFVIGTSMVIMFEKNILNKKLNTIYNSGFGDIENILWQNEMLLWNDQKSVKLYDINTSSIIGSIVRDTYPTKEIFNCFIRWYEPWETKSKDTKFSTLIVGWGDQLKFCRIVNTSSTPYNNMVVEETSLKHSNKIHQNPKPIVNSKIVSQPSTMLSNTKTLFDSLMANTMSSLTVNNLSGGIGSNLSSIKYVQIYKNFTLHFYICGLVPYPDLSNIALLGYAKDDNRILINNSMAGNTIHNTQSSKNNNNCLELRSENLAEGLNLDQNLVDNNENTVISNNQLQSNIEENCQPTEMISGIVDGQEISEMPENIIPAEKIPKKSTTSNISAKAKSQLNKYTYSVKKSAMDTIDSKKMVQSPEYILSPTQKKVPKIKRPQLHVISPMADSLFYEELVNDALSIKDWQTINPWQYRLEYLKEEPSTFYVISPKDVIVGRTRTEQDHIRWMENHGQLGEAFRKSLAFYISIVNQLDIKKTNYMTEDMYQALSLVYELLKKYVENLVTIDSEYDMAASLIIYPYYRYPFIMDSDEFDTKKLPILTPNYEMKIRDTLIDMWICVIQLYEQSKKLLSLVAINDNGQNHTDTSFNILNIPPINAYNNTKLYITIELDAKWYHCIIKHCITQSHQSQSIKATKVLKDIITKLPANLYDTGYIIETLKDTLHSNSQNCPDLLLCLALLYINNKDYMDALKIYVECNCKLETFGILEHNAKNQIFLLQKLVKAVEMGEECSIYSLFAMDLERTIELLIKNRFDLNLDDILQLLAKYDIKLELQYLHALFETDNTFAKKYHDLQIELYIKYETSKLLNFLKRSQHYDLQKALDLCLKHKLYRESIFIYVKTGNTKKALYLLVKSLKDVNGAITFCKEHDEIELWQELIQLSIDNPDFVTLLLQNIGSYIDPILLVQQIPDGLKINGLRNSLIKIIKDYHLQMELNECAKMIVQTDSDHLGKNWYKALKQPYKITNYPFIEDNMMNDQKNRSVQNLICGLCNESIHKLPKISISTDFVINPNTINPFEDSREEMNENKKILIYKCRHMYHSVCLNMHKDSLLQSEIIKSKLAMKENLGPRSHNKTVMDLICPLCWIMTKFLKESDTFPLNIYELDPEMFGSFYFPITLNYATCSQIILHPDNKVNANISTNGIIHKPKHRAKQCKYKKSSLHEIIDLINKQPKEAPPYIASIKYEWKRLKSKSGKIFYKNHLGKRFFSMEEIETYITSPNTCKCGLPSPLIIEKYFDFKPGF